MYEKNLLIYYNNEKSEYENMICNKLYRIYDCGTIKTVYDSLCNAVYQHSSTRINLVEEN